MPFERKEFLDSVAEKMKQRGATSIPALRALQAVGVVMAKLTTHSEEWNRYLSHLQGWVERTREAKAAAHARLADPAVWEPHQLAKLKSDILQADARIEAWELAMQLPKLLTEGGEQAQALINELDRDHDKTTGAA